MWCFLKACSLKQNQFWGVLLLLGLLFLWENASLSTDKTLEDIFSNCILFLTSCSQGLVVVWELNQERRGKPERIYVSSEHKGRKVTALCWDTAALRVFVGDHVGKVSAIKINTSKQGKVKCCILWLSFIHRGWCVESLYFSKVEENRTCSWKSSGCFNYWSEEPISWDNKRNPDPWTSPILLLSI